MFEVIFLICLAAVWMFFAVVQDLKSREIANWVNFSLIIFALGFRFFWSLFNGGEFVFFYQGLIGVGIFFVLGNLFYYGRMFAGGDAKLLFALGAILPFSLDFQYNLKIFVLFFTLFFVSGTLYGIVSSMFLAGRNFSKFRKEFVNQFKKNRKFYFGVLLSCIVLLALGILSSVLFYFGVLLFVLSLFYLSAKSIDESCMISKVSPKNLMEGDWLYEDVKVKGKIIKKSWGGISRKDIKLLSGKKYVLIRKGIPFSPVFLISFLVLVYILFFT